MKTNQKEEQWLTSEVIAKLALIFILTQSLGLIAAVQLGAAGYAQGIITEDVNDYQNSLYLLGMIIFTTIIVLVILKLKKTKRFLRLFELLAVFSAATILSSAIFPNNDLIALFIPLVIIIARLAKKENVTIRTIASIVAIAGAGAFIGITLGLIPAIIFAIALAVYDIIAVYFTKHMIAIGEQAKKNNFAFMVALHSKKHDFELGNGDLVMPLVISSSIMINGAFNNNSLVAALCLIASFIGLITSIYFVSKTKKPMPALPPQTALMIIIILISTILAL